MTTINSVARNYNLLTPEERFRLIVAAGTRGDPAEAQRLIGAGPPINLRMPNHAPFAHAFLELLLQMFIELQDAAAAYLDAFLQADLADAFATDAVADDLQDDAVEDTQDDEAEVVEAGDAEATSADADTAGAEPAGGKRSLSERRLSAALALGFILKVKADGWKLFCERLNLPPLAGWSGLPGLERLRRALKLAEEAAFMPEGMLRWLNAVRPAGEPEIHDVAMTAEDTAAGLERIFRERVAWWGGE